MLLQWMLVVVMPLLTAACAPHAQRCSCGKSDENIAACVITEAAPEGFKCECGFIHKEPVTPVTLDICVSEAIPCRNDEACPGGRYSYCACVQGGGNCQGYPLRPSTVGSCPEVNKVEASSSLRQYSYKDCECDFFQNVGFWGCRIAEAAPEGFKCGCRYNGAWSCHGRSIGCDEDEYCPADDYTYCGCLRGGGNCNGYPPVDRDQVCDLGSNCDCNRTSDWTKGRYSVAEVIFNTDNINRSNPKPVAIGHELDIPNPTEVPQKQVMTIVNTRTSEFSFERTHGMSMDVGITFTATMPISLTLSSFQSFTFGEKTTTSNQTSHAYWCESPPRSHTRCTLNLMSSDVTVPYTMLLQHSVIPDCVCKSYGNWRSTTSYFSQVLAKHIGPCHRIVSGACVAQ